MPIMCKETCRTCILQLQLVAFNAEIIYYTASQLYEISRKLRNVKNCTQLGTRPTCAKDAAKKTAAIKQDSD